jgi:hypothetical protein
VTQDSKAFRGSKVYKEFQAIPDPKDPLGRKDP